MNKYQEALDHLDRLTVSYNNGLEMHEQQVETLQELIDNYFKMEKALDKACKVIAHTDVCWDMSENGCDYECKNCWKKYLLREEE